jgi:hypothetical protein
MREARSIHCLGVHAANFATVASIAVQRQLYIHIGTHKTGTTSIQAFLRKNADLLAASGVYVPASGTIKGNSLSGHHNIAWQLRNDARFDQANGGLENLMAELDRVEQPDAIISSEDFEYLVNYPKALLRLEKGISEIKGEWIPKYIVFFRRQDRYAVSLYHTLRRKGLASGLNGFLSKILEDGRIVVHGVWCFYLDYVEFVRRWRESVSGQLVVVDYDEAVGGAGLVPTLLATLGVSGPVSARALEADTLNARRPTLGIANLLASWRLRGFRSPTSTKSLGS